MIKSIIIINDHTFLLNYIYSMSLSKKKKNYVELCYSSIDPLYIL